MTSPSLFTNFLWSGVAEGDTAFYQGIYSVFDSYDVIPEFRVIPKNHALLENYKEEKPIKTLEWFTKGYYAVSHR